jgi:hypothetical protein
LRSAAWGNLGNCVVLALVPFAARAAGSSLSRVLAVDALTVAFLALAYAVFARVDVLPLPVVITLLAGLTAAMGLAGLAMARRWVLAPSDGTTRGGDARVGAV